MIKECPTCKRTYSDQSISFCLVDGSILSAPFDPQATQHLPASSRIDPPPTEVMNDITGTASLPPPKQAEEPTPVLSTIASSVPLTAQKQKGTPISPTRQQSNRSPFLIGIIITLFIVISVAALIITRNPSPSNNQAAYKVDQEKFNTALALFRREQYRESRAEWELADPSQRDPRTQFYIAYAFYREGWGRTYNDDALFKQGLERVNRAITLSADGALIIDDTDLQMHTAAELKSELEKGLEKTTEDINPLKAVRTRK